MMLKQSIKRFCQRTFVQGDTAFVVASIGRSGSTLVYDALIDAQLKAQGGGLESFRRRLVSEWSWTLGDKPLYPGCVYKTHDYPEALAGLGNTRTVFLFGSAVEAALSVYSAFERFGPDWVALHFKHLQVSATPNVDTLFAGDTLKFEDQLRRWSTFTGAPVLCMRYEALWDNADKLNAFCGFNVRLPERRPRAEKRYDDGVPERAQAVYGPVDAALADLPDCYEAGAHMSTYFK